MHEEADLLFHQQGFKELAKFCEGVLVLFTRDAKLRSMYAIALVDTDPDRSAEMAKRAIELSRGSL